MVDAVGNDAGGPRPSGKSASAFRTISEVSVDLDVPQHVLRFWETKFPQIKPLKRGGGRRYYRPDDVELLRRIRSLLYAEGYTIKGVQRLLKDARGQAAGPPEPETASVQEVAEAPGRTPSLFESHPDLAPVDRLAPLDFDPAGLPDDREDDAAPAVIARRRSAMPADKRRELLLILRELEELQAELLAVTDDGT